MRNFVYYFVDFIFICNVINIVMGFNVKFFIGGDVFVNEFLFNIIEDNSCFSFSKSSCYWKINVVRSICY